MLASVKRRIFFSDAVPALLRLTLVLGEWNLPYEPFISLLIYLIVYCFICLLNKISIPLVLCLTIELIEFLLDILFGYELGIYSRVIKALSEILIIFLLAPLELPKRSGPFNVGFSVSKLRGGNDIVTFYPTKEEGTTKTKICIEPATHKSGTKDFFKKMFQEEGPLLFRFLVEITLIRLYEITMGVKKDAKISQTNVKSTAIVFIHGLGEDPTLYSLVLTELASEGFIVICPYIKERRTLDEIKGKYEVENFLWGIRNDQLNSRSGIAIETIVNLLEEPKSILGRNEAKLEKIALMGHSFGGGTIIEVCHLLKERENLRYLFEKLEGVLCLDPWFYPIEKCKITKDIGKPLIIINSEEFLYKRAKLTLETPVLDCKNPELVQNVFKSAKTYQKSSINCYFKRSTHGTHMNYSFSLFPFENLTLGASKIYNIFKQNHNLIMTFLAVNCKDESGNGVNYQGAVGNCSDLVII